MILDPQVLGNIFGALIVGGYSGLKVVTYFKKRNQNGVISNTENKCPDPTCHASVESMAENMKEIRNSIQNEIFPKINKTAEDVATIKGWIRGIKGSKI
ncbi:MAG: hypothetical protein ACTSO3_16125 [Candidatus Heimdallarchaeaceae archaeon]